MNQSTHNNKTISIAFRASNDISSRQLIYRERNQNSGIHFYIFDGRLWCSTWNPNGQGQAWTAYNNSVAIAQNEVVIVTLVHNGPNNNSGTMQCYKNGLQFANVSGVGRISSVTAASNLGARGNGSNGRSETGTAQAAANTDYSSIDYLEQAYYNSTLSNADRLRVESYLAIKYGVTLDQSIATDYVRSDSTVIYAATASHNSYRHDIAGIGIDNTSALNQPMSRSINSDGIVTISNASNLDNNEFLVWGNDNDDNGTIEEIYSALPPTLTARLDRVWRVQRTGSPGTVTVSFNLASISVSGTTASDFSLIHKTTNSDFTTGATLVPAASYAGGVVTFNNVNFTGDDHFTLVTIDTPPPPGVTLSSNVSNIAENGGSATITATLNQVLGVNVIVNLALSGTAILNTDYTASASSITIPAGFLTGNMTVTSQDDSFSEGNETIVIDIDSVVNAAEIGTQQVTISIVDDEAANNACDGQERIFTTRLASGQVNTYDLSGSYLGTSTSAYTGNYEMVIDPDALYRYLAAYDGQKITRANLDGSGESVLFDTAPNLPFQIAVDPVRSKIYWSEWSTSARIMCANLDGTGTPVAIASGLYYPTGMQVDKNTGRLFVYYGFESPVRLDRTVTDGNCSPVTFTTLLNTGLNLAYNLTIDPPGARLFFVDYNSQVIRKVNTDGTGLVNVWNLTTPGDQMRDIIYNKNTDRLYWVHTNGVVQTANADGTGGITTVISGGNAFNDSRSIDICVDDAPPRLVSFYSETPDDTYCPGEQIEIRAIYDEAVISGSTLTVVLNNGASVVLDQIFGNEIRGTYTVGATGSGQTINDLTVASISSEAVTDNNSNTRINSTVPGSPNNLADTSNINVDTSAPTLVEVTPVPNPAAQTNPEYVFTSNEAGTISVGGSCGSVTTALVVGTNTLVLDSDGAGGALTSNGGPNNDGIYDDCTITLTDALGCNTAIYNIPPFQVVDTPLVSLSINNATIPETGGSATVTATLSNISPVPVTVNLAFGGTATFGTDYTVSNTSIVIPASTISASITITASHDVLDEDDQETVIVTIASLVNALENGVQQVSTAIIDDDELPSVTLSADPLTIIEEGGESDITATLSAISGRNVTVALSFSGTATFNTDYTVSSTSIIIPAGQLSASILLTASDDLDFEEPETVIVDINSVTNATEDVPQQVTITIQDDVVCNNPAWEAPHGLANYIAMGFEKTIYAVPVFEQASGDLFDNYLGRTQPQKDAQRSKALAFFLSEYGLDFAQDGEVCPPEYSAETCIMTGPVPKAALRHISFDSSFEAKINAASGYRVDESGGDLRAGIYQVILFDDTGSGGTILTGSWGGAGTLVPFGTIVEFGEYALDIVYQCSDNNDENITSSEELLVEFKSQKPSLADFYAENQGFFLDIPQIFEYNITAESPNFAGGEIIGRTQARQDLDTDDVTAISSIFISVNN